MMMVTWQCKDHQDYVDQVIAAAEAFKPSNGRIVNDQIVPVPDKPAEAAPVTKTRKPPKSKQVAPVEVAETPALEVTEAPITPAPKPPIYKWSEVFPATKEGVVAAGKKLMSVKSLEVVRDVLQKFECAKISDLNSDSYATFIIECGVAAEG